MWFEQREIKVAVGAQACLLPGRPPDYEQHMPALSLKLAGPWRNPSTPTCSPTFLILTPSNPAVVEVHILLPTQQSALMALNAAALFPERLWWS